MNLVQHSLPGKPFRSSFLQIWQINLNLEKQKHFFGATNLQNAKNQQKKSGLKKVFYYFIIFYNPNHSSK